MHLYFFLCFSHGLGQLWPMGSVFIENHKIFIHISEVSKILSGAVFVLIIYMFSIIKFLILAYKYFIVYTLLYNFSFQIFKN